MNEFAEGISTNTAQREALLQSLGKYLKPHVASPNPRIISVGSGFGMEAKPVLDLFPAGSYLGIDTKENMVMGARRVNKDVPRALFEVRDASIPESFGHGSWDIVILRHPQVELGITNEGGALKWQPIIDNSIQATKNGGTLVFTADSQGEREIIVAMIQGKTQIIKNEVNEFPTPGVQRDASIIIAKKYEV